MSIELTLEDNIIELDGGFADVQQISDGGYDVGYAAGYESGLEKGYADGQEEGYERGFTEGVASVPDYLSLRLQNNLVEYSNLTLTNMIANAFRGCTELKTVTMPNLEEVAGEAFRDCSNLETFNAPYIKSIGAYAFYVCNKLTKIIIRSESVCDLLATTAFANMPIARKTGYVYVPKALVDSYKAATNWSTYASQIRAIEDYPEITGG